MAVSSRNAHDNLRFANRPDCPHLQVTAHPGRIEVRQTQRHAPFRCALDLAWRGPDGTRQTQTFQLHRREHSFAVEGHPQDVEIDPEAWLLWR